MRVISIKGILAGAVLDVVLGFVLVFVILIGVAVFTTPPSDESVSIFDRADGIVSSPIVYLIGYGCSSVAGYVAARIAKKGATVNGALSSFISVILGIFEIAAGESEYPMILQIADLLAYPIFGLIGGYIYLHTANKHAVSIGSE